MKQANSHQCMMQDSPKPQGKILALDVIKMQGKGLNAFDRTPINFDSGKVRKASSSPAKEAYRKQLAEALNLNMTRIPAFKKKPPTPAQSLATNKGPLLSFLTLGTTPFSRRSLPQQAKPAKPRTSIPQTSERTLDAPEMIGGYYLNLLDWHSGNVLAIYLGNTVYLWDATDSSTSELMTIDEDTGPITSVSRPPSQLWDSTSNKQLRTLRGGHESRVGAMVWNNHVLSTGGMYVCGLKWSASGQQLISGGNDNLLHIWDKSVASSNSPTQWLHRLEDHTAYILIYLLLVVVEVIGVFNSGIPTLELEFCGYWITSLFFAVEQK
ncbi:hypothetical protein C5167_018710 [Papaver somniferum]|uniref:Uncharacterized protein n=1 Tax=Papaver somniferum TaxID=3469 RepID=A0A4Y7INN4_PAPSO|nr:hypothetical protein C5167_018710 [Papaver somniferum]